MNNLLELIGISLNGDMQQLNVISNNLANVNTTGFKRDIAVQMSFEQTVNSLMTEQRVGELPLSETDIGEQTNIKKIIDTQSGSFKVTGQPFDLAAESDGFFEVKTDSGVAYTKKGDFSLDSSGRLVTKSGLPVLGLNGEIRLMTDNPRIDSQGKIWEDQNMVAQIKMVDFSRPESLQRGGDGLFYSVSGGKTVASDQIRVRQGYLESSNVTAMNEMVNLIETMRHFESGAQLIKNYDEMMGSAIKTLGEF